jgi:hypothetical protein
MLNYLKKFAVEVLPSVAATVIGAYIVNHYISKPATDAPVAAAVAPADTRKNLKPADGADVVSIPEPGVKAKGISERAMIERSASEKPGDFKPAEAKSADIRPADVKPAETASTPADSRRHPLLPSPKAVAKAAPMPATSAVETAPAAPPSADDHRDANDLARAAIERLRNSESQPRSQEASRAVEPPHLQDAPRTVTAPPPMTPAVRPLPPPIIVSAPPIEAPAATASIRNDDPNRPTPPAEIPPPPPSQPASPLDIRADANRFATRTTNMAHDMLAKTRSMLHALLPGSDRQDSSSASQFTD